MPRGTYERQDTVKINGEAYKEAIKETGYPAVKISSLLLGRDKTYLANAFSTGSINKDDFAKLNEMFNLNADDYILEPVAAKEPVPTPFPPNIKVVVDMSQLEEKLDKLIKAIDAETVALLDIRKKQNSLENALGKIVQNTQLLLEHQDIDLDSIDDGISKVNSSLNVVKGRLDDISKTIPKGVK